MHDCCPSASGDAALIAAARCLYGPAASAESCTHKATSSTTTKAMWLNCGALRGIFLVSHDAHGTMVCSGGDVYRVWAIETRTRFSTYAASVDGAWPALYFANLTGGMLLGSRRRYAISASLLETQNRSLQQSERHNGLRLSASGASPTREWFRYRLCVGQGVSLSLPSNSSDGSGHVGGGARLGDGGGLRVDVHNPAPFATGASREPRCRAVPPSGSSVIVALEGSNHSRYAFPCGRFCTGNASARILRPFRGAKDPDRAQLGFHHILKPEGCHFHWFEEDELAQCLAGRAVLNIGGSVANSIQRGFERISSAKQNKFNWWWDYGRTGINNNHDEATGKSRFNSSTVTTQFIHHPFRHGLTNVLRPDPKVAVGLKSKAAYEALICKHDVVIFESGVHGAQQRLPMTERAM